jgi:hypothetical protein
MLTLCGIQDYEILTTTTRTINVNLMLSSGFSIMNANVTTNFGTSQMLNQLDIGVGTMVTVLVGLPGATKSNPGFTQPIPKPSCSTLMLTSLLSQIGICHQTPLSIGPIKGRSHTTSPHILHTRKRISRPPWSQSHMPLDLQYY